MAKIEGTNVYYYHNDALGTPQKVTDASGVVVWAADYKPFGEVTITVSTITNNLRFPGQYFDQETGLLYNYYRDYNPAIGKYVEADPLNLGTSQVVFPKAAQMFINFYTTVPVRQNLFVYVGNNPNKFIDPLGLAGMSIGLEGAGALTGFGGVGGFYANFAHDPSQPWYAGWSSSLTFVAGGGAAASVYGLTGGVNFSRNNACNVSQLNGPFVNAGRMGLGAFSVGGYASGNITGYGVTIGPSLPGSYIGGFAGGTNTWTITGGNW